MTRQGVWMQITAGALTGLFGPRPKYWGERFLGEGLTHIIATDAHSNGRRVPVMSEAKAIAAKMLGPEEAELLVKGRQTALLNNASPATVPPLPARKAAKGWWRGLF